MSERHYGNDVPTGPIPVIPPQNDTETPVRARPPSIPAQRGESTPTPGTAAAPPRHRWPWVLLVLLIALCVIAAVLLAQGGLVLFLR
jgi:hypothetical protein